MQRGARAAAGMISRSATRISRLAKTPTSSSSSSAATRLLHSTGARFDDRTAGIVGFEPASGSQFYHSSLFPAIFLMGAFGAGSIQTSFADASVEDHSPYAVMDSQKNSEPVKIVASQERKRLEELLQSRRMERGSYPQFYLSVKGKKVTVKFEVPPACEWSHLIVDIVKNLGLSSENIGGGSAMLIRAWDSAAAWQLTLCPSEMKEASGEKNEGDLCILIFGSRFDSEQCEIEFIKQGSFSSNELDTVVSALKIAGEKVDLRKSSGGSQKTFKKSYNHDKYVEKLSALEAMGVRVYGLDETSGVPRDGTISWENIAGYDEQKREIEDSILLALQSPEVYDDIARGTRRKFESNRPRAVLFEGPPGTGKTSSARVIAKQAGVPLLYVPLEVIMSKYYGESERLFGNVFSLANELPSGAIVFLDEVDSFATSRDSDIHEATRRILSVLLRQIDGFEQETQVVIIAATNRKQDLDPALLSRFDAVILFSLPDQQTREEIAAQYAKHLLKTEINLLASATEGMSGRDIRDVCQQAERHWASKLIRGQTSKDVEGTHKLPPIQEYLQCAEKRRETLFGVAALRESQSSRRWKPAALA